jgi:NitT/TauT family transport system permease protein
MTFFFAAIVILLPLWLLTQIFRDVVLSQSPFFSFFQPLALSRRIVLTAGSFLFILALWCWLSFSGIVTPLILPRPTDTLTALGALMMSGELWPNALTSLVRIGMAVLIASAVGFSLGSLAGTFRTFDALILPLNSTLRYPPPTAFIGLAIVWFGIGEGSKVIFIFLALVFYIIQMSADAVRLVPKTYVEVAQTLGATRWEIFSRVILAMSLPELLSVLRINLSAAWNFLIVAEIIAAQSGLGYLMSISQRFLETPKLFALLFVVGFLGFASDTALALLIRYCARWK